MRILIVEDDGDLAAAMAEYLELQGCQCDFAYNGRSGLELAQQQSFDVIILDLMLPKMNGINVCKQLRDQGGHTPILMLTACDTSEEQLQGFRAGIDDYVVKPCPMPLLWARLQALCRRQQPQSDSVVVDELAMYFSELRVERQGHSIKLTPTSWKILELLVRRSPNIVRRSELEEHVWPDGEVESGNLNVHLHQLRSAIDKPYRYPLIHTKVGVGLCLRRDSD